MGPQTHHHSNYYKIEIMIHSFVHDLLQIVSATTMQNVKSKLKNVLSELCYQYEDELVSKSTNLHLIGSLYDIYKDSTK